MVALAVVLIAVFASDAAISALFAARGGERPLITPRAALVDFVANVGLIIWVAAVLL
jgi:hypothetical protein